MTSGTTSGAIKTAIRARLETFERVESVWGFGSFFRTEKYCDVDILIVVTGGADSGLLLTSRAVRKTLLELEQLIGVVIDPLIVTAAEFESRPLRDMHELVSIY